MYCTVPQEAAVWLGTQEGWGYYYTNMFKNGMASIENYAVPRHEAINTLPADTGPGMMN